MFQMKKNDSDDEISPNLDTPGFKEFHSETALIAGGVLTVAAPLGRLEVILDFELTSATG